MISIYVITPVAAWLVAGSLKFVINSVRSGSLAFSAIGYGGLPSNHAAIVSSTAFLLAFREGLSEPALGVAITLAFIVLLDAHSLRRQIGLQAHEINKSIEPDQTPLRERVGHTRLELGAGVLVGFAVAWCLDTLMS